MKIISAQNILSIDLPTSNTVKVISDEGTFFVPISDDNINYQEVLAWVEEGNTIKPADTPSAEDEWIKIREMRNDLLVQSDWTHFNDSPLSDSNKTKWATYREKLRNLPEDQKSKTKFSDITWPTKPS